MAWGMSSKGKQLEPEPEPTRTEKVRQAMVDVLRVLTMLCGAAVTCMGAFAAFNAGSNFHKAGNSFELKMGALFVGGFQVLFGFIVIAGEMRLRCVASLFGFLALRLGKGAFLIFVGAQLCSLGQAFATHAAEMGASIGVGITCLIVGFLQAAGSIPCGPCTLPSDPLRDRLSSGRAASKDKRRGKHAADEDARLDAGPKPKTSQRLFGGMSSDADVELGAASSASKSAWASAVDQGGGSAACGQGATNGASNPFARSGGGGDELGDGRGGVARTVAAPPEVSSGGTKKKDKKKGKREAQRLPDPDAGKKAADFASTFGGGGGSGAADGGSGAGGGDVGGPPGGSSAFDGGDDNPFRGNKHLSGKS